MKSVLCVALWGVLFLSSCRHHAPVTRHFLRIPAEYAGGLSSIQRGQWLKQNRRNLPDRRTLTETGHLVLPAISALRGTVLRGMELLYAGGPADNGGVAAITLSGDTMNTLPHLDLLTCDHANYSCDVPESGVLGSPVAWRIDAARKSITGYARSGSPVSEVSWSGGAWYARRLP